MPTDVIMAMAVARAATSTAVLRKDPPKLRDASSASTPSKRRSQIDPADVARYTTSGASKAVEATKSSADRYPNKGFPPMGGPSAARVPNTANTSAMAASRLRSTRTSNSRRPRAIASVGGTLLASRAGANAEPTATPMPATRARTTDPAEMVMAPGRLET